MQPQLRHPKLLPDGQDIGGLQLVGLDQIAHGHATAAGNGIGRVAGSDEDRPTGEGAAVLNWRGRAARPAGGEQQDQRQKDRTRVKHEARV